MLPLINMKKNSLIYIATGIVVILALLVGIEKSMCYEALGDAQIAMVTDDAVAVTETNRYIFFDGPSEKAGLVFYPGAFVDADAYAPLLHEMAAEGMDCFAIKMPFDFALLNTYAANVVLDNYEYEDWYMAGHSLGGVAAGRYCSGNMDKIDGLLLLASYVIDPVNTKDGFVVTSIYGSEDAVLKLDQLEQNKEYLPDDCTTVAIEGGNHGQFGDYGQQKGDGEATMTTKEQIDKTIEIWFDCL